MSTRVPVKKAKFTPISDKSGKAFDVHFNPVSLQYSVSNTIKEESGGKKKQFITQATGKLTMDLIFDNTHDGTNVQISTAKLAMFMGSAQKSEKGKKQDAPIVLFEWGSYKFQGMMESYKETLDFFSPEGVPLRASVNITLVQQDKKFTPDGVGTSGNLTPDAVDVPTGSGPGGGGPNAQSAATQGGDPSAARALAALNGQASLRFSAGASLTVSGSVQLGPPVAFASGGAGISAGAGAGIGVGGGAGIGIGGGVGISGSASAGIGISGSAASAGVSATEGAFAGLRMNAQPPSFSLNTNNFLPPTPSLSLSTDNNAGFQAGGQATIEGTSGLTADVGATADLRARIQFKG
jgi:hypothetical protein